MKEHQQKLPIIWKKIIGEKIQLFIEMGVQGVINFQRQMLIKSWIATTFFLTSQGRTNQSRGI